MPASQLPSLCLIGTSNGVFETGYSSVFQNSNKISSFSKNCLGFCSSSLFSLMAPRLNFKEFDICVFDFAPNDGVQIKKNFVRPEVVRATVADAIQCVLDAGCLPSLFILPALSVFQSNVWEVQEIYLDLADKYNLPVLDGYAYLRSQQQKGIDIPSLFADDMHLKLPVAAELAEYFLDGILAVSQERMPARQVSGTGYRQFFCPVTSLRPDGYDLISRKTALFQTELLELEQSCKITVPAKAGDEIIAIGVDWANSRGKLTLSSATESNIALTTMYAGDDPKRLIFGLHPVEPVRLAGEEIGLLLADDSKGPAKLALAGLTIRRKNDFSVTTLLSQLTVLPCSG